MAQGFVQALRRLSGIRDLAQWTAESVQVQFVSNAKNNLAELGNVSQNDDLVVVGNLTGRVHRVKIDRGGVAV